MESNDKLALATTIVNRTGCSLFLTGKAGTGKTTFLKNLRATSRKRMIVTAPTGIAAINAGGVTLHSFFQLDFGPFVPGAKRDSNNRRSLAFSKEKMRMIRGLDLLVIDEVSMVRADVLDAVDDVLRRYRDRNLPFGGVQLLLIGDLQQLPPVVVNAERAIMEANYRSPYFFDSHALGQLEYITLELDKVYRQSDRGFISLLNCVRTNHVDNHVLQLLNSRYIPAFNPADNEGYVRLTTHNHLANEINSRRMTALANPPHFFDAKIEGNFPETSYPADARLELKEGAQVMFIKNDTGADRQYFNGMLGTITSIDEDGVMVTATATGEQINVQPMEWENVRYVVDEKTNEITEHRDGVFRQLPLRPAWAITIHKSQGLTFDKATIDASLAFAHGQTYVALSRCRSLEGLVLERPLSQSAVITDPLVNQYMQSRQLQLTEGDVSAMTGRYQLHLIESMFNFRPLFNATEGIIRMLKENFMRLYSHQIDHIGTALNSLRDSIVNIGDKFCSQLHQLVSEEKEGINSPRLIQRVKDASYYFKNQLKEAEKLVTSVPMEHDNKKVRQKLSERIELFNDIYAVREALLETFSSEDFDIDRYLDVKAKGAFHAAEKKKKSGTPQVIVTRLTHDNPNPGLFNKLSQWRREEAEGRDVPAYVVASTKALLAVSANLPQTKEELLMLSGIGKATAEKIGDTLVAIVKEFMETTQDEIVLPSSGAPHKSKKKK